MLTQVELVFISRHPRSTHPPHRPHPRTSFPISKHTCTKQQKPAKVNKSQTRKQINQNENKQYFFHKKNNQELNEESVILVKGERIDLNLIARVGDGACERELERMTQGMSRGNLLGFMEILQGEWCGLAGRRKVVHAADIVKVFPINWKIEIAVRRRAGNISLYCRRYVSPSGIYFRSCKDVAFYLRDQSLIDVEREMGQINNGSRMSLEPISEVSSSSLHEVNNNLAATNDLYDVEVSSFIDCSPCGLTFEVMGDLEKHLAIFHKETTRRFNLPTSEGTMLCTSKKHVVMEHDEPRLDEARNQQNGQASSSSQKMAEPQEPVPIINGKFKTKCTWCYKEFLCEAVDAETMAEAIGFMCPKCKRKVSGVLEESCQGLVNNKFVA